jgi:hypothetical protein
MERAFLRLTFTDDHDGTGELTAEAAVEGFAGKGSAYFGISRLEEFALAISKFPLPDRQSTRIAGGFWSQAERGQLEQEHLGLDVYPVDSRGYIGVQVRMATEHYRGMRADSQKFAKIEIITTYEPLAMFSRDMLSLLKGRVGEAKLEGEGYA